MKRMLLLLLATFLVILHLTAQTTFLKLMKAGGRTENNRLSKTSDDGYINVGTVLSEDTTQTRPNLVITKFDALLNVTWIKTYSDTVTITGGSGTFNIAETKDGGYIVSTETGGYASYQQPLTIFKIAANGKLLWSKHIGFSPLSKHIFSAKTDMALSNDGAVIITGNFYRNTDIQNYAQGGFLMKVSASDGNIEWFKSVEIKNDSSKSMFVNSVVCTKEGNYTLCGYTTNARIGLNNYSPYIASYDSNGNMLWQKFFTIAENTDFTRIKTTPDNGYIVTGGAFKKEASNAGDDYNLCAVKFNSIGDIEWATQVKTKELGITRIKEIARSIYVNADSTYTIGGIYAKHKMSSSFLLKLNTDGSVKWINNIPSLNTQKPISIIDVYGTSDKGFLAGGNCFTNGNKSYLLLEKFNENGNGCSLQNILEYQQTNLTNYTAIIETSSTNLAPSVIESATVLQRNPVNYTITQICTSLQEVVTDNLRSDLKTHVATNSFSELSIAPNPVTNGVLNFRINNSEGNTLQLSVLSLRGTVMLKQNIEAIKGMVNKTVDISSLAAGAYILKVNDSRKQQMIKFIKVG
ncbi:MAG TPA: T9SS type A sorting domain-containing protein [Panacibacter sp.]|nr:T9SS type A sorting domain-containing protein [Panacibacter sp.]